MSPSWTVTMSVPPYSTRAPPRGPCSFHSMATSSQSQTRGRSIARIQHQGFGLYGLVATIRQTQPAQPISGAWMTPVAWNFSISDVE